MTADDINFGGCLGDSPAWMVWSLLALVLFVVAARYLP